MNPKDSIVSKSIKIQQNPLSDNDIEIISNILKDPSLYNDMFYHLRIQINDDQKSFLYTSIPACLILSSHLNDQIMINVSPITDEIHSISLIPKEYECKKEEIESFLKSGKRSFKSQLSISLGDVGPKPKPIDLLKKDETKQEGSWFSRYVCISSFFFFFF